MVDSAPADDLVEGFAAQRLLYLVVVELAFSVNSDVSAAVLARGAGYVP